MCCRNNKGFTLLEVLIVVGLISVMVTMVSLININQISTIHTVRSEMVSLLSFARSEAMFGREGNIFGVRFGGNTIELLAADVAATASAVVIETKQVPAHVGIEATVSEVWFATYSGRTTAFEHISILDNRTGASTSLQITYEGLIE